jgi:hypothetical protein
MFDSKYLAAFHLVDAQGAKRDVTLMIVKVEAAKIQGEGGKQDRKPLVYFEGAELPMIFNKTNGKIVAAMYGPDTRQWITKRITLYATTTSVGGKETDCIRVRPGVPTEATKKQQEKANVPS